MFHPGFSPTRFRKTSTQQAPCCCAKDRLGAELRLPLPQGSWEPTRSGRSASGCDQRGRPRFAKGEGDHVVDPWKMGETWRKTNESWRKNNAKWKNQWTNGEKTMNNGRKPNENWEKNMKHRGKKAFNHIWNIFFAWFCHERRSWIETPFSMDVFNG